MIKKILFVSFIAIIFTACNDDESNVQNADTTIIEDFLMPEVAVADFESKAGEFVGKEIEVSGIVDHVCKHGGKKILLVDGDFSLHVFNDERYDEDLSGSKVAVIGVVEEEKIDDDYLNKWWEHAQGSHSEGTDADKEYLAQVEAEIQQIRDSLQEAGVDHFSEYSLKYVSHKEKK
ncbi:MAG: hypothetical protein L3J35_07540 [Bacteroidales bacterium]|nr:hypothetical protein [Bacteroidales bacterium]